MLSKVHSLSLFMIAVTIAVSACAKRTDRDTAGQAGEPVHVQDSMRKKPIDAIVMSIDSGVFKQPKPTLIPYPRYSKEDTIKIWMPTPGDARISLFMHQPQHLVWPTLHVHAGELIRVRYREHRMFPVDSSAAEVNIYLKNDKIMYAEERVRVLEHMETPGILRTMPFVTSTRSEESLRSLYEPYWSEILRTMAAQGIFLTEKTQLQKKK